MCCSLVLCCVLSCLYIVQSHSGSTAQPTCVLQSTCKMAQFTDDQSQLLAGILGAAGFTPETNDPEAIQDCMMVYLRSVGKIEEKGLKQEPGAGVKVKAQVKDGKEDKAGKAVYQPPPRLSTFSGDPTAKADAAFDLWKYEVECLLLEGVHSEETVKQAIRKSLRGNAARVVMREGTDASCQQIIGSLEAIYGLVETGDHLMAEFFSVTQDKDEDVSSWSIRLSGLLETASEQGPFIEPDKRANMLRDRFWSGLKQHLKDGSRHKHDAGVPLRELRDVVRRLEREYELRDSHDRKTTGKAQAKMAVKGDVGQTSQGADEIGELRGMMNRLCNQVGELQKQLNASTSGASGKSNSDKQGFQKKQGSHAGAGKKGQTTDGEGASGTSKNKEWNCYRCGGRGHVQRECPTAKRNPVCWDCGVEGHTKWNCPQSLNEEKPLSTGGQQV